MRLLCGSEQSCELLFDLYLGCNPSLNFSHAPDRLKDTADLGLKGLAVEGTLRLLLLQHNLNYNFKAIVIVN
jgi:hypothetical protein